MAFLKRCPPKAAAVLLTVFLCLAVCPVFAYAAEGDGESAVIDTDRKGSITVHKYEYNGRAENSGTGETADGESIPVTGDTPAKPLPGVEFTIYKVAELDIFYRGDGISLPAAADFVDENGQYTGTEPGKEKTTDEKGEAVFPELDLGLYLVLETASPDKVTGKIDPFLVSVPMTGADGSGWLYDIHAYPKNTTTYGHITLEKQGSRPEQKLSGVTFALQKRIDGVWTDVLESDEDGAAYALTTGAGGTLTVTGLSQGTYRFIETGLDAAHVCTGYILDGKTVYEFSVGADGRVSVGERTLEKDSDAAAITVPNYLPELEKTVKSGTGESFAETADYSVGDTITYRIRVEVPGNVADLTTFRVVDKPCAGIRDNVSSVTEAQYDGGSVSITAEETENGFIVDFKKLSAGELAAIQGKTVTITYTAELLDTAVIADSGNPAPAELIYTNRITAGADAENPNYGGSETVKTISDDVLVFTFQMEITKEFSPELPENTKPSGVTFKLYRGGVKDENLVSVKETDGGYTVVRADDTNAATQLQTDEQGKITVSGLENGVYILVETGTKEGYNLLSGGKEVTVAAAYESTWAPDESTSETRNVHHDAAKADQVLTGDGKEAVTVINKKGMLLPQTGTAGYLMFCVVGIVLIVCGAVLIFGGRKKKNR